MGPGTLHARREAARTFPLPALPRAPPTPRDEHPHARGSTASFQDYSRVETVIYTSRLRTNAETPSSSLINVNGTSYGTTFANTNQSGSGAIFSVTPEGEERELCNFPSADHGPSPLASLVYPASDRTEWDRAEATPLEMPTHALHRQGGRMDRRVTRERSGNRCDLARRAGRTRAASETTFFRFIRVIRGKRRGSH